MDFEDILDDEKKKEESSKIKEEKKKAHSVFDYINQIDIKGTTLVYNKKECPMYVVLLHYSHQNSYLELLNKLNSVYNVLESKNVYDYLFDKIPKGKKFIKWVKKDKEKNEKVDELVKKYNISYREALESII